ncbi:MAG: sigma 54-interacting transcriptional regulator [Spirochaetales bacterium]|nr:sigma 54-interacting transcriptional regulator [Spirochaetales bacterium]
MESDQIPDLDIAITAGLLSYVPARAKRVIDLGWTVIDLSTLMEIATKLLLFDTELERRLFNHASRILPIGQGLVYALRSGSEIRNQWDIVLEVIDDGVMVIDKEESLLHVNENMKRILSLGSGDSYRAAMNDVIPYDELNAVLKESEQLENELIKLSGIEKSILVTKRRIKAAGFIYGFIIIIKDVTEIEKLENQLRKRLSDHGHIARYNFKDIIGESKSITQTIKQAKKLAKIDANILITGESGTGKELFTQSIHNASNRARGPFIAINCASLVRDLLESELFGYEEGAFTNARKGGKKGLFELAHNGTIFLDEIGEIPADIQAKLLRFLQEKEVMRIGGTTTIPVDVRVIAATNRNLHQLMQEGLFRKDLFYRISVFSLHIPPLSQRKQDIAVLIDYMLKLRKTPKRLSPDLLAFLQEWPWEGNIRELTNCVEYMSYMGGDSLLLDDLPPTFTAYTGNENCIHDKAEPLHDLSGQGKETAKRILEILNRKNMGRRSLHQNLVSEGYSVSEYEVRQILETLRSSGLISTGAGRSGTSLTVKGKGLT